MRLFSCTPSRLATYDDCPRRYRMTYLDRPTPPKGPPWAHNSLGVSVHNALRAWWEQPAARRTPDVAAALVEQLWIGDGYRDEEHSRQWCARARDWVRSYVERIDPYDEPIGVERTVATKTEQLAVSGRVDRLDERGGEVVVVDYKAGRHVLTADDARASRALALYVLATRRTLRVACRRVELHNLRTGEVAAWEHTEESLARHLTRAEATAADIVLATDSLEAGGDGDALFPPRVGTHCGLCDFRARCPEGQAAAERREPWSALGD